MRCDVALAVVRNADGDVLMLRRKVAEGALVWAFPGGKLEPGEAAADAAYRETEEETGVSCAPMRELGTRVHPVTGKAMAYWLCGHVSGEPVLREPDKAEEVAWVDAGTLVRLVGDTLFPPVAEEILGPRAASPESPRQG